ncbi:hypothetical protein AB6D37_01775 [Pectobacterium brasiliense]|uniref:hypothetical protein n=1 Tax=Pectobacterium brasiliense TaxID=180957 RepID=UPI003986430E
MNKITDEVKDTAEGIIRDRLKGPLYAYVLTSLVLFNWDNLAILFISKQDVEFRISLLYVTWDSWLYFWRPFFYGLVSSIIMPFVSLLIHAITSFAVHGVDKVNHMTGDALRLFSNWRESKLKGIENEIFEKNEELSELKKELDKVKASIDTGKQYIDSVNISLVKIIARVVFMAGYLDNIDKDARSLENIVKRHGILYTNNEPEVDDAYKLVSDLLKSKSSDDFENEIKKQLNYVVGDEHRKRIIEWINSHKISENTRE